MGVRARLKSALHTITSRASVRRMPYCRCLVAVVYCESLA